MAAGFDVFPPCLVHRLHRHDVGVEPLVAAVSPRIAGAAFPDAHGVEVQLRPEIADEKRIKLLFQQGPFLTGAGILIAFVCFALGRIRRPLRFFQWNAVAAGLGPVLPYECGAEPFERILL